MVSGAGSHAGMVRHNEIGRAVFPITIGLQYIGILCSYVMRALVEIVNIRGLKKNPSEVLRKARHDLVVVMNRDKPDAVLMHLEDDGLLDKPGVRTALATALFKDGHLSLGRSAKLAGLALGDFMTHVSRLGIPVIGGSEKETRQDLETLEQWLRSSSPTPAR
jgi:predicted HTH domain antitoxin